MDRKSATARGAPLSELGIGFVPVVIGIVRIDVQVDDHMLGRLPGGRDICIAVLLGRFLVEKTPRDAEHQPSGTPVREVQERVEVPLHQLHRITAEVAPVILVDEAGRGDLGPARQRPQFGALALISGQCGWPSRERDWHPTRGAVLQGSRYGRT